VTLRTVSAALRILGGGVPNRRGGIERVGRYLGYAGLCGSITINAQRDICKQHTQRQCVSCTNSIDTRYQRADEHVDERWIGENPKAHYAWHDGETVPIPQMRQEWGV